MALEQDLIKGSAWYGVDDISSGIGEGFVGDGDEGELSREDGREGGYFVVHRVEDCRKGLSKSVSLFFSHKDF